MPEVEQVVIEIDQGPAVTATSKANEALEQFEKRAKKATDSASDSFAKHGEVVVRFSDRSKTSVERLASSAEKLALTYGKTGIERLVAQRDQLIARLGGEEKAIERVRSAYGKMIDVEEKAGKHSGFEGFGEKVKAAIEHPLQAAGSAAQGLLSALGPIGTAITGVATVLVGFAVAGFEAAKSLGEFADRTKDISVRTGLTITEVGQFSFAMQQAGGDISQVESIMRKLSQGLGDFGDEGKKQREGLRDLGITAVGLNGALRPMSEILEQLSGKLNKLEEGPKRNAAAIKIMGRGALEVLPDLLELGEGLRRARELSFGASEQEIQRWDAYHKQVAEATSLWDQLVRRLKEPIVVPVLFALKWAMGGGVSGGGTGKAGEGGAVAAGELTNDAAMRRQMEEFVKLRLGIAGPQQRSPIGLFAENSFQVQAEAQRRNEAAARGLGSFLTRVDPLTAAQTNLDRLKRKYEEARNEAERLADAGAALPSDAERLQAAVAATAAAYHQASDLVKELSKDEAKRISNLERMRDLAREGQTFLKIGSGALQAVVSGQEISDVNQPLRRAPQLRRRGELNPEAPQIPFPLPEGIANFGISQVFVSPESARIGGGGDKERLKGFAAAVDESQNRSIDIRLSGLRTETELTARLIELRTRPGGELGAAQRIAEIRQTALQEEFRLTGDIVRFRESSMQNEAELRLRMAEIERGQFESIKRAAESLMETLFTRPREFGQRFLETVRNATLRPIMEGLADRVAGALQSTIFGSGGTGGIAGSLRGLFGGSNPVTRATDLNTMATQQNTVALATASAAFSGGALAGVATGGFGAGVGGGPLASLAGIVGGPGGTSGFAGPVAGLGGVGGPLSRIGLGGTSALGGAAVAGGAGLLLAGLPRAHSLGGTAATVGGGALLGTQLIVGGHLLGALGGAGVGLFGAGLVRGGLSGLGMTIAGGAIFGAQYGGPIGALIGAGVGAIAGTIRLFFKGAEDKMVEKVKAAYSLTIDRSFAKQLVALVKQNFGGNIDVGIRSPQIKDMLELYAMSSGQNFGTQARLRAVSLVESGSGLFQNPIFENGRGLSFGGSLPVFGGSATSLIPTNPRGVTTQPSAPPIVVEAVLNLNPQQTMDVFEGRTVRVIMENPRAVAAAATEANRQNFGRRNNLALQLAPGSLTS